MLDIKYIRENADAVKENCKNRNVNVDIDRLLALDEERRNLQQEIDDFKAVRNKKSKGKPDDETIKAMKGLGEKIASLEGAYKSVEPEYLDHLLAVPNITHQDSPVGGENDFAVVEERGEVPQFGFEPKDHEALMTELDLIDFERGAKVAGSKFYFVKNDAVRLNQALLNYGMDVVSKHGYTLLETPDMARDEILEASGFNPRGEESQTYKIEGTDLNLIGTAEITVLGYHADEVLDLSEGPKKYAAISHCYRREAGAYGKANKGLYRVHQFSKLEMFIFCKQEESEALHQELLEIEKEICDGLGLAYRVIDISTGDLGGPAYRKYDLEAWMAMKDSDDKYGEITSASNCLDYQARRMNVKYKDQKGKKQFVHTLNGTAVVLSRFPIAIIEQFQNEAGKVNYPEVLKKFM
jgi:seryl-tRNA synthetase